MNENRQMTDKHVGKLLSGYVDGELTQQQRQLVTLHCELCEQCREELSRLHALRERVRGSGLSEVGEDKWRETMNDSGVEITRGIGWLIFIIALLVIAGTGLVNFVFTDDMSIGMKLVLVGIYGGLLLLLFSVLRQRLIERKTDKYKDVEI